MSDSTDLATARDHGALTPAVVEEGRLLNAIIVLAKDPAVDVAKLSALMDMQERMEGRQAVVEFNQAFARMEPLLPRVKKNGEVWYPVNKNQPDGPKKKAFNFARWEDVDDAIRPLLRDHGFHLMFNTTQRAGDGGGVIVTGKLKHVGGHEEVASFALPLDTSGGKSNLQGYASSTSFGQRYCAKLLLNIVFEGEDDDGVAGGQKFITDEQAAELRAMTKEAGRQEGALLDHMFSGKVRSFEELDPGSGYLAVRNTLSGIINMRKAKG
jgi:hypothetical protein